MKVVFLISFLFLNLITVSTAEENRVLLVSHSKASGVGYDVQIMNRSNVPTTAFVILSQHTSYSGGIDSIYHLTDSLYDWPIDKSLQPMESRIIKMGPAGEPGHEALGINLLAAIFADGTSVGDPTWVDRILRKRKQIYSDILITISIIEEARLQQDPTPFATVRMEELKLRNLSSISASPDRGFERPAADKIAAAVILNLESKVRAGTDPRAALQQIVGLLREWKSHLEQSKPSLN